MIWKTQHRKLTIKQHEPHKKAGVKLYTPKDPTVSAPLVTPIM